jgi:hypothetical protein
MFFTFLARPAGRASAGREEKAMVPLHTGSRARRVATRLGVVAAGLGLILAPGMSTAAHADTGTLKYTCTASGVPNQLVTAVVHGTAPATAAVGETVALSGFAVDVSLSAETTGLLYHFLGVRSVIGTAAVGVTVDNAGTPAPLPNTAVAMPDTAVPATGALTVTGTGTGPSFVTTTAGTVKFQAGGFTAEIVGTNTAGEKIPLPVACALDAGQDSTIASVAVA